MYGGGALVSESQERRVEVRDTATCLGSNAQGADRRSEREAKLRRLLQIIPDQRSFSPGKP